MKRTNSKSAAGNLPSPVELATIAATIGQARPRSTAQELVREAVELWDACCTEIQRSRALPKTDYERETLMSAAKSLGDLDFLGTKPVFPISYEDFLKLSLRRRRPEDRAAIARALVQSKLPKNGDLGKEYKARRDKSVSGEEYGPMRLEIIRFADEYKRQNISRRNRANARKKTIDSPSIATDPELRRPETSRDCPT